MVDVQKEKNVKEYDSLMFGFSMKNAKESNIIKIS